MESGFGLSFLRKTPNAFGDKDVKVAVEIERGAPTLDEAKELEKGITQVSSSRSNQGANQLCLRSVCTLGSQNEFCELCFGNRRLASPLLFQINQAKVKQELHSCAIT